MEINKTIGQTIIRACAFFLLAHWYQPVVAQPKRNQVAASNHTPDYAQLYFWAAHPLKKDPSDSLPAALKTDAVLDKAADVFFIHPTGYTQEMTYGWNAPVDDEEINKITDNKSILYQASVFNASCRVYAPRYRQVHLNAFYTAKNEVAPYFDLAYGDIRTAFEYYLRFENAGRPIIIASHSQGTYHAGRLLKEFFEGKALMKRLVCAYIVGLPVPEHYFSGIPPCRDSTETGCFVSWRTFRKGYTPEFVKLESFKSVVVNPLSWKLDEEPMGARANRGGILMNFEKIIPRVVSCRVKGNVLWSSKPNIFGKMFILKKNFHIGDYNLFYMNIRENVACRITHYRQTLKDPVAD